ncbi:TIGR01440 family protein [Pseudogracilibacillus auburnensis]|uniref:TIGR01440 family protein n=1 Tax=Pseudogracilibacillus auburnensis TaxID=1494959 RepID=UPI001A960B95|nr:TIGR01440 family protein [Pseudogracilibacillus auburnensis]MBO1004797.1 TIGR01440 family protein [Pseudogracilibacillus auburnensis]
MNNWKKEMEMIVREARNQFSLEMGQVLVVGCSTSEVAGKAIGTSGTLDVAEAIYTPLKKYAEWSNVHLAFQCCEHLNRALVVEKTVALEKGWEIVSVIPDANAGGSMATYAYRQFKKPVVVEYIKADAGIDIGETLIGMHLKHVAVPIRINQKYLGDARVTLATTRPKLIGGARAIYE